MGELPQELNMVLSMFGFDKGFIRQLFFFLSSF